MAPRVPQPEAPSSASSAAANAPPLALRDRPSAAQRTWPPGHGAVRTAPGGALLGDLNARWLPLQGHIHAPYIRQAAAAAAEMPARAP